MNVRKPGISLFLQLGLKARNKSEGCMSPVSNLACNLWIKTAHSIKYKTQSPQIVKIDKQSIDMETRIRKKEFKDVNDLLSTSIIT